MLMIAAALQFDLARHPTLQPQLQAVITDRLHLRDTPRHINEVEEELTALKTHTNTPIPHIHLSI